MPVCGYRLINPWGRELMYEATSDGVRAWARKLQDLAVDAIAIGNEPRAVWAANKAVGEYILNMYRREPRLAVAVVAARDFCLAPDTLKRLRAVHHAG